MIMADRQVFTSMSQMSLNDNSRNSMKTIVPKGNNIFLCGFTTQPVQNNSLIKLLQDLSIYYYVSCQPSSPDPFSLKRVRGHILHADVCVFYMYDGSLRDKRCLTCVQSAWELMVPLIILRHPQMRLVMAPLSRGPTILPHSHSDPDYRLLQDIFTENYRQSVGYNGQQHTVGLRQLLKRLSSLLRTPAVEPTPNGFSLQIPNINSHQSKSQSIPDFPSRVSSATLSTQRSKSATYTEIREGTKSVRKTQKRPSSARGRRRRERRGNSLTEDEDSSGSNNNKVLNLLSSSDEDPLKNISSLEQPQLYHPTQYIIFPAKDKTRKPMRVLFPQDVINTSTDSKPTSDSIWASDSEDIEHRVKQVEELQGAITIPDSPTQLAPFEDDLKEE